VFDESKFSEFSVCLNYDDAARVLCVSKRTLRRLVHEGQVRHARIGNSVRFTPAHLEEYIARVTVPLRDEVAS
jgi:excisionase family DNA binding protein